MQFKVRAEQTLINLSGLGLLCPFSPICYTGYSIYSLVELFIYKHLLRVGTDQIVDLLLSQRIL